MAADPLQDEHGSKAERVKPKPSFGTYEESDSCGPDLRASSTSSAGTDGDSDDGDDDFLERLRRLQEEAMKQRRRTKKKRLIRPPGLGRTRSVAPAVARAVLPHQSLMAACRSSAFGSRRSSRQFSHQFSHRFSHDFHHFPSFLMIFVLFDRF